jgi:hypothetical protein
MNRKNRKPTQKNGGEKPDKQKQNRGVLNNSEKSNTCSENVNSIGTDMKVHS